jgi:hypothetical protein
VGADAVLAEVLVPSAGPSEFSERRRVARIAALVDLGAKLTSNGQVIPAVAVQLERGHPITRQYLNERLQQQAPGLAASTVQARGASARGTWIADLSNCGVEVHVVQVPGGTPPPPATRSVQLGPPEWGITDVTVATGRPSALILIAYDRTRWRVRAASGTALAQIVVLGYRPQMLETAERAKQVIRTWEEHRLEWIYSRSDGIGELAGDVLTRFGREPSSVQYLDHTPVVTVDGTKGQRATLACGAPAAQATPRTPATPAPGAAKDKYDLMVEEALQRSRSKPRP